MFWSASRLMSKPVRLLARRTDSYVHAHTVLRSPMRLFGAVAGAPTISSTDTHRTNMKRIRRSLRARTTSAMSIAS